MRKTRMTKFLSSEAQKKGWTNRQSKLLSRRSVDVTKDKRKTRNRQNK